MKNTTTDDEFLNGPFDLARMDECDRQREAEEQELDRALAAVLERSPFEGPPVAAQPDPDPWLTMARAVEREQTETVVEGLELARFAAERCADPSESWVVADFASERARRMEAIAEAERREEWHRDAESAERL